MLVFLGHGLRLIVAAAAITVAFSAPLPRAPLLAGRRLSFVGGSLHLSLAAGTINSLLLPAVLQKINHAVKAKLMLAGLQLNLLEGDQWRQAGGAEGHGFGKTNGRTFSGNVESANQ